MSENREFLLKLAQARHLNLSKAIASVAVCLVGAFAMKITNGETGIGWAIFGIALIWGT